MTAMIQVIEKCFSEELKTNNWATTLKKLVPSYGESLIDDAQLLSTVRARTLSVLKLG